MIEGRNRPGALEIERAREAGWIEVQSPQNRDLVKSLQRDLDEGEAEANALAVERKAAVVFFDETDARRVADIYGLHKTGVIGVLICAKREERISSLKDELDRLRENAGFWIDDRLYEQVFKEAGEV